MKSKVRVRTRPKIAAATQAKKNELRLDRLEEVRARLAEGHYDDPAIDDEVGRILARLLSD